MDNKEQNPPKIRLFSKRSTKATVVCLTTVTAALALFNSSLLISSLQPTPAHIEILDNEEPLVLEEMLLKKDNVVYHREDILNDYHERIVDDFTIPENLRDRVGFWFDVYTRYTSHHRVIHHSQFPWVILNVKDVTDIINAEKPKARWMRNQKADDAVALEVKNIKAALKAISLGKYDENNETHAMLEKALEPLKGTLRSKAKSTLNNMRVQTGQKNFFASGLEVSPRYLPGMEEIFANHKLPKELTRLPFVESSFNKHAVSKVGAAGIWQFMGYTGKSFMTVNDQIDERRSPFKATVAAARLLKENHMILKRSWPMAITAWNHGPGGIRKAAKAAKSTDLGVIVEKYQSKSFDFASSNFYCEFLAALYAEKYHDEIYEDLNYEPTLDLHAVKLAKKMPAKSLLTRSGLAKEDFLLYNPDLNLAVAKNHHIPSGFTVMVDTPARLILNSVLTKDTRAKPEQVSQSEVGFNEKSTRN